MNSPSPVQQCIINTPGNMIVRASAGTGKTYTMVWKIAKEIEENSGHKVIAAITFTRKAAKEIRDRLAIDVRGHFIGTNNSFVIEEIVKPFARDVYGQEFDVEMSADYSVRYSSFEECLDYLKNNYVICSYKENAKNFVFQLALDIVKKSKACQLFLRSKYFKVYVDEYQDCDEDMHKFFMYLVDELNIDLFAVGDTKQSIFRWRGARPEMFEEIWGNDSFIQKELKVNYRSHLAIQNYSNLLYRETCDLYMKVEDVSPVTLVLTTQNRWEKDIVQHLDMGEQTALLRYRNENAETDAVKLSRSSGKNFVYVPSSPISGIATDVYSFCNAIVQYCILPQYSIYDFMDEMLGEFDGIIESKEKLQVQLNRLKKVVKNGDKNRIKTMINCIAFDFGYEISELDLENTLKTICEEKYHAAFSIDELTHISSTFHSSKGLAFKQVIVFASDYPLDSADSLHNHYVAVTRAKSKLLIVCLQDWECKKYCRNLQKIFSERDVALHDVVNIVRS